jgi:hypothetical protein
LEESKPEKKKKEKKQKVEDDENQMQTSLAIDDSTLAELSVSELSL